MVIVDKSDREPMIDLILGIGSLAKSWTVLDFQDKTIQIDNAKIAIGPFSSLSRKYNLSKKAFQTHDTYVPNGPSTFTRNHLEPINMQETTKRTIKIVDADYNKLNTLEIAKDNCGHLYSLEQIKLL